MKLVSFPAPTDSPMGSVLLSHGFGEHHRRYSQFIQALSDADYDVWTFDFSGHGAAATKLGVVDVGALIVEHLEARRAMMPQLRSPRLFLFGHSMGGMVTLASTLLSPAGLTGTAVTGPGLRPLPPMPLPLARLGARIGRLLPGLKTITIDNTKLSHDPEISSSYADDPWIYQGGVPLLTGSTMIVQGAEVIANAELLAVPVLILHAGEDVLTDVDGSREFVERGGDLAELRVKDGNYHELLNEVDREAFAQEIISWYGQL